MLKYLAILIALTSAAPVSASGLMAAAGRINIGPMGGCSAALIEADLVLTAAHCVIKTDGKQQIPEDVEFQTGAYPGRPVERRATTEIVVHPLYQPARSKSARKISYDLALIRLAQPISTVTPFPLGVAPKDGERILIASWRTPREHRARERFCNILTARDPLLTVGCEVNGGESGSPLMRITDTGPEIVAVMSARGENGAQKFGLAAFAKARVGHVRALLLPQEPES